MKGLSMKINELPYISQACVIYRYQEVIHENKLPCITHVGDI